MHAINSICTEQDIHTLVNDFYAHIRKDALLGPIFHQQIQDWPHHLQHLTDFWSSILLHTGHFSGNPAAKHAQLSDLSPQHFERWLALFKEATERHPNKKMGDKAYMMAQRIAQSLWSVYQSTNTPSLK